MPERLLAGAGVAVLAVIFIPGEVVEVEIGAGAADLVDENAAVDRVFLEVVEGVPIARQDELRRNHPQPRTAPEAEGLDFAVELADRLGDPVGVGLLVEVDRIHIVGDRAAVGAGERRELFKGRVAAVAFRDREKIRVTDVEGPPPAVVTVGGFHTVLGFEAADEFLRVSEADGEFGPLFFDRQRHMFIAAERFKSGDFDFAIEDRVGEGGAGGELFRGGNLRPRLLARPVGVDRREVVVVAFAERDEYVGEGQFVAPGAVEPGPFAPAQHEFAVAFFAVGGEFQKAERIFHIPE